jgi:conflict system pore-forming effector with SLATT domain
MAKSVWRHANAEQRRSTAEAELAMAAPAEARLAPQTVSSIEEALAARRRTVHPVSALSPEARAGEQLLASMRTVKAARFNAAERFERKHTLSLFAMSMVSLYFVGLSVWQAVYAPTISEQANRLITLVSIMSSIFSLVLALIESMNDYRMKAHHMHACALAVNDLYHEFKLMRPSDPVQLQQFRYRYNGAVRRCPYNHSRIDYLMAKAEDGVVPWTDRAWARLRFLLDVYGLYGLALIVPPLVLVFCA